MAEYDEFAAPDGSTELSGYLALAVGACSPSWRLAKSPVGYEPWRCHDCHGTLLFRGL